MPERLSTKPLRRGDRYCAPFCGYGCTWEEYQDATRNAAALALRLGKKWTPHVWENLGWHYAAISPGGAIKVHAWPIVERRTTTITKKFIAYLGDPDCPGGTWVSDHLEDPRECVTQVMALAREEARALLRYIRQVRNADV